MEIEESWLESIVGSISQSKGYKSLSEDTIRRIVWDLAKKYDKKTLEKESKNKLHQIWGAFYSSNPNFSKIIESLSSESEQKNKVGELSQILILHTSTAERLSILSDFWEQIFGCCSGITSITEFGSGLNGLGLLYFQEYLSQNKANFVNKNIKYIAYDIDKTEIDFLNKVFSVFGVSDKYKAQVGDIFIQDFEESSHDLVLLLKLLPTLERQEKGISKKILKNIKSKFIAVSFPVFSISQRNKNMTQYYTSWFEELLNELQLTFQKLKFKTEIVYIINQQKS